MCSSTKSDQDSWEGFHSRRENRARRSGGKVGNQSDATDRPAKVLFAALQRF